MKIIHFELNNFRNIFSTKLDFDQSFNILFGRNGAGKTSLLEAIYFLGMGRSFRSRCQQALIKHNNDKFSIFTQIKDDADFDVSIGVERSINGIPRLRIAQENINTHISITKLMPIQLIAAKDYRLIESGPEFRRQFLDWGVFHVEHVFLLYWQKMRRIVKQRNALLKEKVLKIDQLEFWDQELEQIAIEIDRLRANYVELLKPVFYDFTARLLGAGLNISLEYYAGWDKDLSLKDILKANLTRDSRFGCTSFGPHRADIKLTVDDFPVVDILSRGQQKLLIYALRLAQGLLLKQIKQVNCIYLIDDLPSELDDEKAKAVIDILSNMNNQSFITGIDHNIFNIISPQKCRMFHVKHGEITPFMV